MIFSKKIKGKWILLEKNKQHIRELNKTAGFLWELTEKTISIKQLAKKLSREYRVDTEIAEKDTKEWVSDYLKKKLLIKTT